MDDSNQTDQKRDEVQIWMGLPMRWNAKKMFSNFWNKNDDRIFPPKHFGIGWDLNFRALFKKVGLIAEKNKE